MCPSFWFLWWSQSCSLAPTAPDCQAHRMMRPRQSEGQRVLAYSDLPEPHVVPAGASSRSQLRDGLVPLRRQSSRRVAPSSARSDQAHRSCMRIAKSDYDSPVLLTSAGHLMQTSSWSERVPASAICAASKQDVRSNPEAAPCRRNPASLLPTRAALTRVNSYDA